MSALDIQVGGSHYREGGIQPIQYIEANSLQFLEASVVKRVTRHNRPTGKGRQDIEKAIHELQLLLELRYGEVVPVTAWVQHDGKGVPVDEGTPVYFRRHNGDETGPHKARAFPPGDWQWIKPGVYTIAAYRLA